MKFKGTLHYELEIDPSDVKDLDTFLDVIRQTIDEDEHIYLEVNAQYSGYYDKGRLYGAPENCYPPEFDIEIGAIVDNNGTNVEGFLAEKHINELLEHATENWQGEYYDNKFY